MTDGTLTTRHFEVHLTRRIYPSRSVTVSSHELRVPHEIADGNAAGLAAALFDAVLRVPKPAQRQLPFSDPEPPRRHLRMAQKEPVDEFTLGVQ